ncbi:protein downstream neighbor of son homolog [Nerophis lumbriciformis]|uniref:protein downstream neighbor of son homolog n=1 Tax=Nerophis lumbriciformis TaxID=546530 RepID=UPI002ADF25AA|nr:protein downstream neighbor of son homolog [Nerophis lumbriciformis]
MSDASGYSPSFKRPSEIMRMRRKRARSEASSSSPSGASGQSSSSPPSCRPFAPGPLFNKVASVKRRNPFANIDNTSTPSKRRLIHDENDKMATTETEYVDEVSLLERLQRQENCSPGSEDDSLFEESEGNVETPLLLKSPQAIAPLSIEASLCSEYPPDWSLKTRLLFSSLRSLSWSEQPKAQEEALGLSQHCRTQFITLPHSLQDPRSCSELRCAFQQSLIYWQHPSLPWVPLFPRMNANRRFTGTSAPWAQDATLQQSLMNEWSASLSSLYSLLKSRLCPYFYVCAYQFTVLFRTAGLAGSSSITALISPTARGLREAMEAEGIEFSMPLLDERKKTGEQQNPCKEQQQESAHEDCWAGCEDDNENGGSSLSWLKQIGVQDKIKNPDRVSMQLRKESQAVSLDHKPESVLSIEGPHTFTLINFLINCKSIVATAGSQAGLPPTLLAPLAFRGAAMHSLKARCVNVKSQVGSTYQNVSCLEIAGPILPSSLHTITTLLGPAQKGNFSATLHTHTPTAIMNVHNPKQQCVNGTADLSACGLHPASIQQLQQSPSLGKTALMQITMEDYSYTWKN